MEFTKNWEEINDLIDDLDYVELAEHLSFNNLAKLENAYIVRIRQNDFTDKENIKDVIDLSTWLYISDEQDHSSVWYVDRVNYLIDEKNFSISDFWHLANTNKSKLFDMVYKPELVEKKELEQGRERER